MNNPKGFVLVSLLAFLPVLISGVLFVGVGFKIHDRWTRALDICRQETLGIQKTYRVGLEKLFALNPKAAELRRKFKRAKNALKLAPEGASKALAGAYLASIVKNQLILAGEQKKIIFLTNAKSRALGFSLKRKLSVDVEKVLGTPPGLRVMKNPLHEPTLTPDYMVVPDFSRQQQVVFRWSFDPSRKTPGWVWTFLTKPSLESHQCGATLKRKGPQWNEVLLLDKSS